MRGTVTCFIFSLFFLVQAASGQKFVYIYGVLEDEYGKPCSYVTIYFKEADRIITTDTAGQFELELPAYSRTSLFINDERYKKVQTRIVLGEAPFTLKIVMNSRANEQITTTQKADDSNPANIVIREALKKRSYFLNRFHSWQAQVYLKNKVEVVSVQNNFPRLWEFSEIPDSSQIGLMNLQESYATLYYRNFPRLYKEDISMYRAGGRENEFTYNGRLLLQTNFYDRTIDAMGFYDMEFLSPLNWGAFIHYKFELIEQFYLEDQLVNRIRVTPKNDYSRVFRGEIWITESDRAICGVDLTIPSTTLMYKADSVRITHEFKQVKKGTWMPVKKTGTAWMKYYGTQVVFTSEATLKEYEFDIRVPIRFFGFEQAHASENAENWDEASWAKVRPAKIGKDEKVFMDAAFEYKRRKELPRKERKEYVKAARPEFRWFHPPFGGTILNPYKPYRLYVDGFFNDKWEFNTVEGLTWKYTIFFTKFFKKGWKLELEPTLRTGTSDLIPRGKLYIGLFRQKHQEKYLLEGGHYYFQINSAEPVNSITNSFYTLFLHQNLMKLYRKDYIKFTHEREIINGLYFNASVEFASRYTLENRTDFTFVPFSPNQYTPNNPNQAFDTNYQQVDNRAFKVKAGFTYKLRQNYMTFAGRKIVRPSGHPLVSLFYTKGIPRIFGSDISYDLLEFTYTQDFRFKLLGKSSVILKIGTYLNNSRMAYFDYTHFLGERIYFLGASVNGTVLDQFRAITAYQFSTNMPFVEFHYQHDFKGFLFNLIPGFKRLKWNLLVGLNALQIFDLSKPNNNYIEVFIGLDNLLGGYKPMRLFNIRIDVAMQIVDGKALTPSVLLGIGTRFSELF